MSSKILKYLIFFILRVGSMEVDASEIIKHNNKTLNLRIQYAGNLGLLSSGIGFYDVNKNLHSHVTYGYLPECINGAKVHTFGIKTSYRFASIGISEKSGLNYYTGITLFYARSRNSYIIYPDYFTKGYYKSNAIWSSLFLGSKLDFKSDNPKISIVSVFAELGMLDNQIGNAVLTKHIDLKEILDISFGVAFTFQ